MDSLRFYLVYSLPASVAIGLTLGGWWTLATVAWVFVIVPLLDAATPLNQRDPIQGNGGRFEAPILLWTPVQVAIQAWVLVSVSRGTHGPWETAGIVLSCGVMAGAGGITVAHELMHRVDPLRRALAEILMGSVAYTHFCVEHVLGHHRNVATPNDPATSRLGESLYAFLPRTLVGGLRSAWHLESRRCERRGIRFGDLRDRRLRYPLCLLAAAVALLAVLGPVAAAAWLFQAAIAVLLLESIDYVEHYGLQRDELDNGRYERVAPHHSWNSEHAVSGAMLLQLTRHSDHHARASATYPGLATHDDAPQLPAGYGTMTLVALVPPLWRRVMDPRVPA